MRKKDKLPIRPGSRFSIAATLVLVALLLYSSLCVLLYLGLKPPTHDLTVGSPARETIYATKDIKNSYLTNIKREQAAQTVENIFLPLDDSVQGRVTGTLDELIAALTAFYDSWASEDIQAMTDAEFSSAVSVVPFRFDRPHATAFLQTDTDTLSDLENLTRTAVINVMRSGLREGSESDAAGRIQQELLSAGYSSSLVSTLTSCVKASLKPNILVDEEATEAAREAARDTVEDEIVVKGEVIVRQGELVTEEQYTIVQALGLLSGDPTDWHLFLGIGTIVLALEGSLAFYLIRFEPELLRRRRLMILLAIVLVLTVGLCLLASMISPYLMPVSLALLLISLLIEPRLGVFCNFLAAVTASLFASGQTSFFSMGMFSVLVMAVVSGPLVASVVRTRPQRTTALIGGLIVCVCNFLATMAVGMITSSNFESVLDYSVMSLIGGPVSAVLAIGLQPLFETLFNLTTPAKLLELSNPSQPLLRRLQVEAPGTYHHSIIVANLAEAACTAVGANGLLARVGAFYHDIGKLRRPIYFVENQMGDNPHDRIDPRTSASIITSHPRDGAVMALKEHLPPAVCDMVLEHHGDTLTAYFYAKAKELDGDDVDPADFRYPGPRPHSREAAILMLSDMTEAATRTLQSPSPEKLMAFVRKLVHDRLTEGQLDECELTFKDLDRVCEAFYTILSGAFHERIEYPDVELPERESDRPEHDEAPRSRRRKARHRKGSAA